MQKDYTVGAWARQWFTQNEGKWNANILHGYRNLLLRHIVPGIGKMKLTKLKPAHIQKFYLSLAENDLGSRSVLCSHLLLRRILDAACKDDLIDVNPSLLPLICVEKQ